MKTGNFLILIIISFFLFSGQCLYSQTSRKENRGPKVAEVVSATSEKVITETEEIQEDAEQEEVLDIAEMSSGNNATSLSFVGDDEISALDWSLNNLSSLYLVNNSKKNRDCAKNNQNPTYSDQEYKNRLKNLPAVIDLPYNKIVQTYIDFYANKRRDQVEKMLGLSDYYFPMFESVLEANNMPLELVYLPVIESALNPNAFSKAGASGLWQFMIGTGKIYGLTINSLIDERRDPIKSTNAGVKYLKDLYEIYNDWHLAIAAYNCGPGNVNKAIKRAGGKKNYWEIYYYLPKETRGYVPAFIAANYIMQYYDSHNLCPEKISFHHLTDTVIVKERMNLKQVSEVLNIPLDELRILNPQYRVDILPGNNETGYTLCLPTNRVAAFIDQKDNIFAHKADEYISQKAEVMPANVGNYQSASSAASGDKVFYKVKSGDYLGKIASRYNVSVTSLKKWNNLKSNSIKIGQRLVIYTKGSAPSSSSSSNTATASKTTSSGAKTYTVKQGDSLWTIAQKYPGISSDDIMRANKLSSKATLRIGQVLQIPGK